MRPFFEIGMGAVMLERLTQQPPDALLALIKLYSDDARPDKVDLGVGVYRTGQGDTPASRSTGS